MGEEPGVLIRTADPDDLSATAAVRWSVGWSSPPSAHYTWPEADQHWLAPRYFRELVAEVDGVVAGRIGLEAYRQPFAELMDLSVRPDFRRRGIGERLTLACQTEAARRGFRMLFLQTELDNVASQRLYSRLGFVPTAYGKMLRMVKFVDCPLLSGFLSEYPLSQYSCVPVFGRTRAWNLEWHAYITDDYLRFCLEGGATQSESAGLGPALSSVEWSVGRGARVLTVRFTAEETQELAPGHFVELEITLRNSGKRAETGVFQLLIPPDVAPAGPVGTEERSFVWDAAPGEEIRQRAVVRILPSFDTGSLWVLNYKSVPICMEVYWEGCRALLTVSLPMAATRHD